MLPLKPISSSWVLPYFLSDWCCWLTPVRFGHKRWRCLLYTPTVFWLLILPAVCPLLCVLL